MNYSDFIYDFNLYLCERFGYRNCCSVMYNANGICISVHVGEMDLYIRFWEYSCGVGSIPDWSIIIVRSNFKRNQQENLKDLARFFKEYAPRYGYKYLCTEDDDYKYYQTLGLKLSKHSDKCTFYTLRFDCSFAAANTIKPQLL